MANTNSAEKRIRINQRNHRQNKYYKTSVKTLTKNFFGKIDLYKTRPDPKNLKDLKILVNSLYSFLDRGTKKNVFHKNSAARLKARLSNSLKSISS